MGGWPESPLPSLLISLRFAKASVASSTGWRTFFTNMVSDTPLHCRTLQALPPFSPGFRGLNPSCFVSGVDLQLWAHEHSYERLWPIYNYQVREASGEG